MKKGNLSKDSFSYKEQHRFNDNNFILVVKDEEYPDRNVLSILYKNNNEVFDIDDYDMGAKILATPNRNIDALPLGERFPLNELLKISHGNIISNDRYHEHSTYPKSITFHTNINSLESNEIIEIFEGTIEEAKTRFKLKEDTLATLITDVYLESDNCFFIFENEKIFGPFEAIKRDSTGQFVIKKSNFRNFGEYENNEKAYIEFEANEIIRRIYVPNFNSLKLINQFDFVSDDQLLESFKINLSNKPEEFNPYNLEELFDQLKKASNIVSLNEFERKNIRLKEILQKSEKAVLSNLELGKFIPELQQTKEDINDLREKKLMLQNDIIAIEEKKLELSQIKNQLDNQKIKLENELKDITQIKEEALLNKKTHLDQEILNLEERKLKLDFEIEEERKQKSKELISIEEKIKDKKIVERELDGVIQTLKDSFVETQGDAQKKLNELIKHKTHFDLISGRDLSTYDNKPEYKLLSAEIGDENKFQDYKSFRRKLIEILEKNNRKFENHFIDNVLISIHQNTLTLFAGLPGTGKTSLVRLITNILAPKERIREISVGRGWSSQKDLIGFFNPLSRRFHASTTNLYSLLKQLDWEHKENKFLKSPLGYVLLDEANLSPLEHYWSSFYNLTDSFASEKTYLEINLGESESLSYANNLRFIGTINYDQTTEDLSPRVVDRANIIRMSPRAFEIDNLSINDVESLNISYNQCIDFFELIDFAKEQRAISMNIEIEHKYKEIKIIFKGLKIYISPRVEIAIKRYCNVAKNFMVEENRPLDYCVAQRLLPLIRIQGANNRQKLNNLLSWLKNNKLDISFKILEDIIQAGAEGEIYEDNYNYFLTLSHV